MVAAKSGYDENVTHIIELLKRCPLNCDFIIYIFQFAYIESEK